MNSEMEDLMTGDNIVGEEDENSEHWHQQEILEKVHSDKHRGKQLH